MAHAVRHTPAAHRPMPVGICPGRVRCQSSMVSFETVRASGGMDPRRGRLLPVTYSFSLYRVVVVPGSAHAPSEEMAMDGRIRFFMIKCSLEKVVTLPRRKVAGTRSA